FPSPPLFRSSRSASAWRLAPWRARSCRWPTHLPCRRCCSRPPTSSASASSIAGDRRPVAFVTARGGSITWTPTRSTMDPVVTARGGSIPPEHDRALEVSNESIQRGRGRGVGGSGSALQELREDLRHLLVLHQEPVVTVVGA